MCNSRPEPRSGALASPLDVNERRKNRKQRVGRAILKLHSSTYQFRDRSFATAAKRPGLVRAAVLEQVEKFSRPRRWRVPHDVQSASWHDHEIAGGQLYRLRYALDFEPAPSANDDMKSRSFIAEAEPPWRAKLRSEIDATSK